MLYTLTNAHINIQAAVMNSKGPNNLSLNSYTQQQDGLPSHHSSYLPQANNQLTASVQQNFDIFVRQIRQRDQILHELAKDIDHMSSPNSLVHVNDFLDSNLYTNFGLDCRYEQDQEKKVLAYSDGQINKVLSALETQNGVLKEEVKGWNFEFAKTAMLTHTLLRENKILRGFISQKNKDIVKLINALQQTENPEMDNLEQSIRLLKQQASILANHGTKLEKQLKQKKSQQLQVSKAINEASLKRVVLKTKIQELEDEEEHAAKKIVLTKQNQRQFQQRQKHLLSERARLLKLKHQYQTDSRLINQQIQQKRALHFEPNSQTQLRTDLTQTRTSNQASKAEYEELVERNRLLEQETRENEERLAEYGTQNRKLERKLKDYEIQLQTNQQKQRQAHKAQTGVLSQIDIADAQIRQAKQQLQERVQSHAKIQANEENALKMAKSRSEDELTRLNKQLDVTTKSSSQRMIEQQSVLAEQSKEMERIKAQIAEANKHIQQMYAEIRQQQKQQQLARMPMSIHQQAPTHQQMPIYQQVSVPQQRIIASRSPTNR